jgi:L-ribulokinase
MGTSICHMLLAETEVLVNGICGIDEDGTVTGYFGYEADEAGIGDRFSWFVENNTPPA